MSESQKPNTPAAFKLKCPCCDCLCVNLDGCPVDQLQPGHLLICGSCVGLMVIEENGARLPTKEERQKALANTEVRMVRAYIRGQIRGRQLRMN